MFEKTILVTVASLLTIGCGTTSHNVTGIHAVQNLPVEPPKSDSYQNAKEDSTQY